MSVFQRIGLIGRADSESTQYSLQRLLDFLYKQNVDIILDEESATLLPESGLNIVARKDLGAACDLIIVVGGDGSSAGSRACCGGSPR
ncbi:MAG: hypothetical protein U5O16_03180 [Rhodococcus sp. (in: high G+C Gram-positive bacteria)]|uniref:hypothetical protein n=1 Tax=Rhodococcus sp. TaxID=1831 RepID=UPI002AD9E229|nr:hypothetical protein [Rhodococcus sp. (in: high G+C Gram-positive bacteria)]